MENHSMLRGLVGKTITGEVWNHDIECVLGAASERCRVGEHGNEFDESQERIGIAVGENDGKWIRAFSSLVNEVDAYAVNVCFVMRELIERRFLFLPIVGLTPVGDELLEISQIGPSVPV